jgi:hypothetical protein
VLADCENVGVPYAVVLYEGSSPPQYKTSAGPFATEREAIEWIERERISPEPLLGKRGKAHLWATVIPTVGQTPC